MHRVIDNKRKKYVQDWLIGRQHINFSVNGRLFFHNNDILCLSIPPVWPFPQYDPELTFVILVLYNYVCLDCSN